MSAVEERLRAIGLSPRTIGRNTFSADAPLRAITDLMDQCDGAVVIAVERFYFPEGEERRGSPRQSGLTDVCMPTAWNQIEAAMAYSRRLPLLVIVDQNVRADGLLEKGNDWYVQDLPIEPASLSTPAFNGILESWRSRLRAREHDKSAPVKTADPSSMTLGQIVGALKPGQFWATMVALAGALTAAFVLGANLLG
ncbi:hypothetical protein [Agromyces sp. ZXT2-6]|uniref:hypothetical protein n=1 Tax=Agromyces sp. ZXT2-6 TaxID=3461153 RepID=UPI004054BEA8